MECVEPGREHFPGVGSELCAPLPKPLLHAFDDRKTRNPLLLWVHKPFATLLAAKSADCASGVEEATSKTARRALLGLSRSTLNFALASRLLKRILDSTFS